LKRSDNQAASGAAGSENEAGRRSVDGRINALLEVDPAGLVADDDNGILKIYQVFFFQFGKSKQNTISFFGIFKTHYHQLRHVSLLS
jgi:hypothetical protein